MQTARERVRTAVNGTRVNGSRTCEEVQQDMCRLAADAPTSVPVALLARHARHCDGCASYVDALARARRRLERGLHGGGPRDGGLDDERDRGDDDGRDGRRGPRDPRPVEFMPGALAARARVALARELAARLARDLHDLGAGGECRPSHERERDVLRLTRLRGPLDRDPWPVAARLVVTEAHRPINRRLALRLACSLDPVGLDVAIGHLQALERTGRGGLAHAETERLLALMG